jgi:RimJ/RimL family protein N-acetyltransferase
MKVTLIIAPLTAIEEADLNSWFDQLDAEWEAAIQDPNSPESQSLAAMEAAWLAQQEYYQDLYLYADQLKLQSQPGLSHDY